MAVSPSLLAGVKPVPEDWIPPRELLLGLGEPWEPFLWDSCYDTEDVNVDLLVASQQYEAVLQNSIDEENVDSFLLAASQDYEKSTEVSSRWAPQRIRVDQNTVAFAIVHRRSNWLNYLMGQHTWFIGKPFRKQTREA